MPSKQAVVVVTSVIALATTAACSGAGVERERVGASEERVVGGVPENAEGSGVVMVTSPTGGTCSGVLLDNSFVLTAAHCFTAPDYIRPWDNVTLTMGSQTDIPAAAIFLAPNTDASLVVALHPFRMNGDTWSYYQPVSLADPQTFVGSLVRCYGYGYSDWADTMGLGQLRSGAFLVNAVTIPGTFKLLDNGLGLDHGDSGGPCIAWANGLGASSTLLGIQSTIDQRVDAIELSIGSLASLVAHVPLPGVPASAHPGVDPNTGLDYCAGAQTMCSIHRRQEYMFNAAQCVRLYGVAPYCDFPDPTPVCNKVSAYCTMGDYPDWRNQVYQCLAAGGSPPDCPLWPTPVGTTSNGAGGSGGGGGSGSSGGHHGGPNLQ